VKQGSSIAKLIDEDIESVKDTSLT